MTWNDTGKNRGSRHNRRVRGGGTWGDQLLRLYGHQQVRYGREMGHGTWGEKSSRLRRAERRRERDRINLQRRTAVRKNSTTIVAGVLILGAVLLMSRATRGTGLVLLVLTGLILYVLIRRKRT